MISAFVYSPPAANVWNDVIVGAAIGIIAGYDAYQGRAAERRTRTADADAK